MSEQRKTKDVSRRENEYKGGQGIFICVLLAVVITAAFMTAIMILSKLNMGEVPSLFGLSLESLFKVG